MDKMTFVKAHAGHASDTRICLPLTIPSSQDGKGDWRLWASARAHSWVRRLRGSGHTVNMDEASRARTQVLHSDLILFHKRKACFQMSQSSPLAFFLYLEMRVFDG